MEKKIHEICNGRACCTCPLFDTCLHLCNKKGETAEAYKKRFYETMTKAAIEKGLIKRED